MNNSTMTEICPSDVNFFFVSLNAILHILFGLINFIFNSLMSIAIYRKPTKSTIDRYSLMYASGASLLTLNMVWEYSRAIWYVTNDELVSSLHCMYVTPYSTLYSIADIAIAQALFFMALDFLISLAEQSKMMTKWNKVKILSMGTISFASNVTDVVFCWKSAINNAKWISIMCVYSAVLPEEYFMPHYIVTSSIGIGALVLLLSCVLLLLTKKSVCTSIREVQIKRQTVVMKKLLVISFFTFISQTVPHALIVYIYISKYTADWISFVWLGQIIIIPLYPVIRFFEDRSLIKGLKVVFPFHSDSNFVGTSHQN
ncbi:hypothetical protein Tsp_07366 [Trichinella spiralis]|uniref:G-protein coupled receptors family 1 profile domain-containing protein n=2 Tax=Trichinella spiralis TaxID=6334 RepID=E5RYW9_TRISP|nr:hypothetical protein Tsp_07366 [Trichinella spiralis]KRY32819.1 hypothetical protein T01_3963 [Trichinella spiralis]